MPCSCTPGGETGHSFLRTHCVSFALPFSAWAFGLSIRHGEEGPCFLFGGSCWRPFALVLHTLTWWALRQRLFCLFYTPFLRFFLVLLLCLYFCLLPPAQWRKYHHRFHRAFCRRGDLLRTCCIWAGHRFLEVSSSFASSSFGAELYLTSLLPFIPHCLGIPFPLGWSLLSMSLLLSHFLSLILIPISLWSGGDGGGGDGAVGWDSWDGGRGGWGRRRRKAHFCDVILPASLFHCLSTTATT